MCLGYCLPRLLFGFNLEPLGCLLGSAWSLLGLTCSLLRTSWAQLGPSWTPLALNLEPLECHLGSSWTLSGAFGLNLHSLGALLGVSWGHFGSKRVRNGFQVVPSGPGSPRGPKAPQGVPLYFPLLSLGGLEGPMNPVRFCPVQLHVQDMADMEAAMARGGKEARSCFN